MGVYKPRILGVLLPLLPLTACGLERDLEHLLDVADANTTGLYESSSSGQYDSTSSDTTSGRPDATFGDDSGSTSSTGATSPITSTAATDAGSDTTGAPRCGDGQVDADEECDDDDATCSDCKKDWLVFVTSTVVPGNFAEAGPLEAECNRLAGLAGLLVDDESKFFPWISTGDGDAADYLHHARGRYVLRNGAVLADNWDALVAGELKNAPNIDESGKTWDVAVWTGTDPHGTRVPQSTQCNGWTEDDFDFTGTWGYSARLDAEWTQWGDAEVALSTCGGSQALYCFEQP